MGIFSFYRSILIYTNSIWQLLINSPSVMCRSKYWRYCKAHRAQQASSSQLAVGATVNLGYGGSTGDYFIYLRLFGNLVLVGLTRHAHRVVGVSLSRPCPESSSISFWGWNPFQNLRCPPGFGITFHTSRRKWKHLRISLEFSSQCCKNQFFKSKQCVSSSETTSEATE